MHECLTLGLGCNLHWHYCFENACYYAVAKMLDYFCLIAGFIIAYDTIEHDELAAYPNAFEWLVSFSTCSSHVLHTFYGSLAD